MNGKQYNKPMKGIVSLTELEIAELATYIYNTWNRQRGIVEVKEVTFAISTCQILSWQDGMWYVVATVTTVGYGDVIPVTYWGRTLGFVVMLSSLGVYGFIISQIANFMSTIKEQKELGLNGTNLKNHVVIIGWNDFSQSVISHLVGANRDVAVITNERSSIDHIREFYSAEKVYTLYADFNNYDLLEKANIRDATIVFVNLKDDTEKLVYVINLKKHFAGLNYVDTSKWIIIFH